MMRRPSPHTCGQPAVLPRHHVPTHRKGDPFLLMQVIDRREIVRLHADIVKHGERNEVTERRLSRSESKALAAHINDLFHPPDIARHENAPGGSDIRPRGTDKGNDLSTVSNARLAVG